MQASPPANTWNRKALLCSFETSKTQILLPALVLLLDIAFFSAGTAIVLLADSLLLKLPAHWSRRLRSWAFLVGHDACHGSFFSSAG
jgi:fatty acid desaturase